MQHHANALFAQIWPTGSAVPSGPMQFLDFRYYWSFFLSLPLAYKLGLICLAALLYYAIRRQYEGH
jgi:hypothetical protein